MEKHRVLEFVALFFLSLCRSAHCPICHSMLVAKLRSFGVFFHLGCLCGGVLCGRTGSSLGCLALVCWVPTSCECIWGGLRTSLWGRGTGDSRLQHIALRCLPHRFSWGGTVLCCKWDYWAMLALLLLRPIWLCNIHCQALIYQHIKQKCLMSVLGDRLYGDVNCLVY